MKTLARLLTAIFRPDYYPMVGFTLLFTITYLYILPWQFKLWVLSTVCLFTVLLPSLLIFLAHSAGKWCGQDSMLRRHHYLEHSINIICYLCCIYVFRDLYIPTFMGAILVVSLMVQCAGILIGVWHRISMPCAGTGLIIGSLLAYSGIFGFDPTWWLCAAIVLSGAVMSSQMYVSDSTMGEVMGGTFVGILCGAVGTSLW